MSTFLKPRRKRGFHRALKRKEPWALTQEAFNQMIQNLYKQMWDSIDVYKENPFLKMIGLKEAMGDKR